LRDHGHARARSTRAANGFFGNNLGRNPWYNFGMSILPREPVTLESFVEWALAQEARYEFADGTISAFPGSTMHHADIVAGLVERIRPHVRPGKVVSTDMLLRMERSARFPDIIVTFDERDFGEATYVQYPKLVIEVLSKSTNAVDRSAKLDEYRSIETVDEYVLVDSRKRWAQTNVRTSSGDWITSLPIVSGTLTIASIGLTFDLDELYAECGL
jgi:Uma2 family endonuclease